jgi:hypothetical protein
LDATRGIAFVEDKTKAKARAKRLMDCYKLTPEMYDIIWAFQYGVCYACDQPEPVKGRRLSVDHDHTTGAIRGLLCSRCNPLLGKIENAYKRYGLGKVTTLTVATFVCRIGQYLRTPPAWSALGIPHFGYPGRTGTKAHRKRLKKEAREKNDSSNRN